MGSGKRKAMGHVSLKSSLCPESLPSVLPFANPAWLDTPLFKSGLIPEDLRLKVCENGIFIPIPSLFIGCVLRWRHLVNACEVKSRLIGFWQNLGAVRLFLAAYTLWAKPDCCCCPV